MTDAKERNFLHVAISCPNCDHPLIAGRVPLNKLMLGEYRPGNPWCHTPGCRTMVTLDVTPKGLLEVCEYETPWDYQDKSGERGEDAVPDEERTLRRAELGRMRRARGILRARHYRQKQRKVYTRPRNGDLLEVRKAFGFRFKMRDVVTWEEIQEARDDFARRRPKAYDVRLPVDREQ